MTESLSGRIEDRDQTLLVDVDPDLPEIEADGRRLRQVLQNIIHNANIHTEPGTTICVSARIRDEGISIVVADDGPGLPFENPDDAFSSFRHAGTVNPRNSPDLESA